MLICVFNDDDNGSNDVDGADGCVKTECASGYCRRWLCQYQLALCFGDGGEIKTCLCYCLADHFVFVIGRDAMSRVVVWAAKCCSY